MAENEPEVPASALGPVRPLSIRITDGLRAQLDVIAQLNDGSVTEEIRLALEVWVETSKSDPQVLQRAGAAWQRARLRERHQAELLRIREVLQACCELDWVGVGAGQLQHDRELHSVVNVRLQAIDVVVLDLGTDDGGEFFARVPIEAGELQDLALGVA